MKLKLGITFYVVNCIVCSRKSLAAGVGWREIEFSDASRESVWTYPASRENLVSPKGRFFFLPRSRHKSLFFFSSFLKYLFTSLHVLYMGVFLFAANPVSPFLHVAHTYTHTRAKSSTPCLCYYYVFLPPVYTGYFNLFRKFVSENIIIMKKTVLLIFSSTSPQPPARPYANTLFAGALRTDDFSRSEKKKKTNINHVKRVVSKLGFSPVLSFFSFFFFFNVYIGVHCKNILSSTRLR